MARIPVEAHYASEFRYRQPTLRAGDVVFVVSMSGETTDAVESLREVRKGPQGNKLLTAAVVNNPSSTLAKDRPNLEPKSRVSHKMHIWVCPFLVC